MRQRYEAAGIVCHFTPQPETHLWKRLIWLRRKLKHLKGDLVHIHYMAPGFMAVLMAWLSVAGPITAMVHYPGRIQTPRAHRLLSLAAHMCRRFLTVSESVERSWFGTVTVWDPSHIPVGCRHLTLYNAVDLPLIDRVAEEGGDAWLLEQGVTKSKDIFLIGVVGRLSEEKGQSTLLYALAKLDLPDLQWKLIVIGDGAQRERWQVLACTLGIESRISWLGNQPLEVVYRWMHAMDLLVVPSRYEGFGLTAAEGMATSTAVIASDVDGLREIVVPEESGLLVPPDDVDALVQALSWMVQHPVQRTVMGCRGRRVVAQKFSQERYTLQVAAILDDLFREEDRKKGGG
uniref:Putative GT4 n=1 Tax=Magnetococcus massalia (strain MO-1) TaxID=451514 RepID=A0A1S7LK63_MAGMO|nr:putative GT4 [Candidatus Magnetococcus massalia]